jgi:glucosamine kinase
MELFLGVDGGQSSTTAVVGNRGGQILGVGKSGPCNHARQGEGRAKLQRALTESVNQALLPIHSTVADTHFAAACMGMSGGPDDKHEIIQELLQADSHDITTDAHIALYGAIGDQPGAIVIAGTGSIALSRDSSGVVHRAGGWGYVFGDQGSGFDIARHALGAALRAEEGWGPSTALRETLLTVTGASSANDLLHRWYAGDFSRDQTAAWSQLVEKVANSGDPLARSILTEAGKALAELGVAALAMASIATAGALICPIGGVFRSHQAYESFAATLDARLHAAPAVALDAPEMGAFHAARRGIRLDSL